MTIIDIIVAAIVICVVLYIVRIVMSMITLPEPIKQLVWLIIAFIVVVYILNALTGGGGDILNRPVT